MTTQRVLIAILCLLGTAVATVSSTILKKFLEQRSAERLVMEVVEATTPMLPQQMDGGLLQFTRAAGEGRMLVFYHRFLSANYEDIDLPNMTSTIRKRTLERIHHGKSLSSIILKGIPIEYRYADKHDKPCFKFRIVREDLISYRQHKETSAVRQ